MAHLTFSFPQFEADHQKMVRHQDSFARIFANAETGEGRIWAVFTEKTDIHELLARVKEAFKKYHFFEKGTPILDGFYLGRPVWIVEEPKGWAYEGGPIYVHWDSSTLHELRRDSSYMPASLVPAFPMSPPLPEEKVARAVEKTIDHIVQHPYTYGLDRFMKRTGLF